MNVVEPLTPNDPVTVNGALTSTNEDENDCNVPEI